MAIPNVTAAAPNPWLGVLGLLLAPTAMGNADVPEDVRRSWFAEGHKPVTGARPKYFEYYKQGTSTQPPKDKKKPDGDKGKDPKPPRSYRALRNILRILSASASPIANRERIADAWNEGDEYAKNLSSDLVTPNEQKPAGTGITANAVIGSAPFVSGAGIYSVNYAAKKIAAWAKRRAAKDVASTTATNFVAGATGNVAAPMLQGGLYGALGTGLAVLSGYVFNPNKAYSSLVTLYKDAANVPSGTGVPMFTDNGKFYAVYKNGAFIEAPVDSITQSGNDYSYTHGGTRYMLRPSPAAKAALDALKKPKQTTTEVPGATTWKPPVVPQARNTVVPDTVSNTPPPAETPRGLSEEQKIKLKNIYRNKPRPN